MSKFKSRLFPKIGLITLGTVCALTQLIGCMSTLESVTQATKKTTHTDSDVIRYIGYPSYQGVRQKGMVLLADKHSYLISSGDELLEQLTTIDQHYLKIEHPVLIQAYSDNTVTIRLKFTYHDTAQNLSKMNSSTLNIQQKNLLSTLCVPTISTESHFAIGSSNTQKLNHKITIYPDAVCQLELKGGMYQPISLSNTTAQVILKGTESYNNIQQQALPVQIHYLNTQRVKSQVEVGVIPMSVVVDTLTLPLQILLISNMLESL